MRPSSLAQAMIDPDSATEPISAPSSASTSGTGPAATPAEDQRSSSTAPIAAADPPPRPLYSATICGMSVIATFLPEIQATAVPIAVAAMISRSEEHTSELQSRENLVCRLLLEKKK